MYIEQGHRDHPLNWALTLGTVFGIRLRVHLLFILWTVFLLFRYIETIAVGVVIIGLFFAMVLLHEFGHCFGARAVGGDADDILMWPLGGLATVQAPMTPRAQFLTTAAGPLVNLIGCLLAAITLAVLGDASAMRFNPFALFTFSSLSLGEWTATDWLLAAWDINYILLLFNLLPTFPLDGGRILQAVVWAYRGYHRATLVATFVGMAGAIVLGLAGLIANQLLLLAVAALGYITCWQHRHLLKAGMLHPEGEFGFEGYHGYGELADEPPRRMSWWARRRAARMARLAELDRTQQAERQARIDEILCKVHRAGLGALNHKERKLLNEETRRQRESGL